jgi:fatty-acid desaturase
LDLASIDSAAAPVPRPARKSNRLALPAGVNRNRIEMRYAVTVGLYHLVALLAVLPWFFSWTGVILAVLGLYVFGSLGINLYYHRMLTHRGLTCPRWVERILAISGVCCVQDTPARWVAIHRRHHEHADQQPDPHSPLVNFFWGHMAWMLVENPDLGRLRIYERYAKDIVRDPFQKWLERNYGWIVLAHWVAFYAAGTLAALITGSQWPQAMQFGASVLIWGVFVRTVVVWHITWSVNSVTHLWGYRNYETGEDSRNNIFVGLISNGEGWHNNHHADPRSARHGHRWWELDVVYLTIRAMAATGLAQNVILPKIQPRP